MARKHVGGARAARLGLTRLEDRTLPASGVAASLSSGILRINDYKPADSLVIRQTPTGVTVDAIDTHLVYTGVTRVIVDVVNDDRVTNDVSGTRFGRAPVGLPEPAGPDRDPIRVHRQPCARGHVRPGHRWKPDAHADSDADAHSDANPDSDTHADNRRLVRPRPQRRRRCGHRPGPRPPTGRSIASTCCGCSTRWRPTALVNAQRNPRLEGDRNPDWTAGGTLSNQAKYSMPAPVRGLTGNVVDGDAANATYQGTPLGNLQAGSAGAHLQKLVLKWFLGTDRPVAASGTTYTPANGALFVNGPAVGDIRQGRVSDCYFLAALGELAQDRPQAIRDMFTENSDGTVTVRFFRNGQAKYVTVDRSVPIDSTGRLVYAGFGATASNPSNELWVVLAEKAYAQLNQSGWTEQDGTNRYIGIADGYSDTVMMQVTGGTPCTRRSIRAPRRTCKRR